MESVTPSMGEAGLCTPNDSNASSGTAALTQLIGSMRKKMVRWSDGQKKVGPWAPKRKEKKRIFYLMIEKKNRLFFFFFQKKEEDEQGKK